MNGRTRKGGGVALRQIKLHDGGVPAVAGPSSFQMETALSGCFRYPGLKHGSHF